MTCRHPHALSVLSLGTIEDRREEAVTLSRDGYHAHELDRWCPDCGSVRVWLSDTRPTWVRPGSVEAGRLKGGG